MIAVLAQKLKIKARMDILVLKIHMLNMNKIPVELKSGFYYYRISSATGCPFQRRGLVKFHCSKLIYFFFFSMISVNE
ncbi:hypothetical protein CU633_11045 [Bacillus sp. V3-13]|nr:hypothetical protein CU633_11045 [Bacillus sp. V3-13]